MAEAAERQVKNATSRRIMLVCKDSDLSTGLRTRLEHKGYGVLCHEDPYTVVACGRDYDPDLFILDMNLSELSGLQVCRLVRAEKCFNEVPVILLGVRQLEFMQGMSGWAGVDEYWQKPFAYDSFIDSIANRLNQPRQRRLDGAGPLRLDGLRMDTIRRVVEVGENTIDLTPIEFELLKYLIQHKGQTLPRETVLGAIWKYDGERESRTLDTHIQRIRKKLGVCGSAIKTLHGQGYRVD